MNHNSEKEERISVSVPREEGGVSKDQYQNVESDTKQISVSATKLGKKAVLCIGVAVLLAVILVVLFITVIRPNSVIAEARIALSNGDFLQCEELLNKVPNHKEVSSLRKDLDLARAESFLSEGELEIAESMLMKYVGDSRAKELREDVQYARATDLIEQGLFGEAKMILDKIPNHEDPRNLKEAIVYQTAVDATEKGDYGTAYDLFSQLDDYRDAAQQKEILYYEALALKTLLTVQTTLKNPASLRVTEVTFYENGKNEGELDLLCTITASNSFGGSITSYAYDVLLYDGEDGSGSISHSAYVDPDDYLEKLQKILIDVIKKETVRKTSVDVARMNRLLVNNVSFNIDLPFQSGTIVEN